MCAARQPPAAKHHIGLAPHIALLLKRRPVHNPRIYSASALWWHKVVARASLKQRTHAALELVGFGLQGSGK
jgi:hypothetical protein